MHYKNNSINDIKKIIIKERCGYNILGTDENEWRKEINRKTNSIYTITNLAVSAWSRNMIHIESIIIIIIITIVSLHLFFRRCSFILFFFSASSIFVRNHISGEYFIHFIAFGSNLQYNFQHNLLQFHSFRTYLFISYSFVWF